MKRLIILVLIVIVVAGIPAYAGNQKCTACNTIKGYNSNTGCFGQRIIQHYDYFVIGPSRKADGLKNDQTVMLWANLYYYDQKCNDLLDWFYGTAKGCAGFVPTSIWPDVLPYPKDHPGLK